jgi:thioredoxin-dependent peroxiredoxin
MRLPMLALALLVAIPASSLTAQAPKKGRPTAVFGSGPEEGRKAPDFSLPWAGKDGVGPTEQAFGLKKSLGKVVVLAFYPRDFTSGCTAELRTFAEQHEPMFGPDVVVVGISADSLETHSRFAASLNLPFALLSDPDQRVAKMYGSKDDNGYNRRTVYVIGADGRVAYRDLRFGALDPKSYASLKEAVRRARG